MADKACKGAEAGGCGAFRVARGGAALAAIVLGRHATRAEEHAARELEKYLGQISGAAVPVFAEGDGEADGYEYAILIGTGASHGRILELIAKGELTLSESRPGLDGFVIKTVGKSLVLGGSRDRGTVYAVYHLLEKYMKVGFFWDGDSVHPADPLFLPEIDLSERPAFALRFSKSASECNAVYNFSIFWEFDEWKNEIDWMIKNKINLFKFDCGRSYINKLVYDRMAIAHEPVDGDDIHRMNVTRRIYDYCRELDLETMSSIPKAEMPHEIVNAYPDHRFFYQKWSDTSEDSPEGPPPSLYTWDPLYKQYVETFVRILCQTYGRIDYFVGDTACESRVDGVDDKTVGEMFSRAPREQYEAVRAGNPNATIVFDGWIMRYSPMHVWDMDGVLKDFVDGMPEDKSLLIDLWPEWRLGGPLYKEKKFEYTRNRPFMLTFLNEFGGNDYLHGSYDTIIGAVRELRTDPGARNCAGIGNSTEVMYFNVNYYDLMFRLAWNPGAVDREEFIKDQAERRYGPALAADAGEAFGLFVEAAHTGQITAEAHYQRRILLHPYGYRAMPRCRSRETVRRLERYFGKALPFPKRGRGSAPMVNDVYDALRQYITELANLHIYAMHDAYMVSGLEQFEAHAAILSSLMDQLERLVRSNPRFHVERMVRQLTGRVSDDPTYRHIRDGEALGRYIRDKGLTFAVYCPELLDYPGRDYYELIRRYYRPRVDTFISYIRHVLSYVEEPILSRDEEALKTLYRPVELAWVEKGYGPEDRAEDPAPLWETAEAVCAAITALPGVRSFEEYK